MVRVSVVVPAYNCSAFVEETLLSVTSQTFQDLEILVINDGSTDETVQIVKNIPDSRIQIFSYENGGVASARNYGIQHASGEYISFLDADDIWEPQKIENQVLALEHNPTAGVAYSWTSFFVEENGEKVSWEGKERIFQGNVYNDLLVTNFLESGSNLLARKSVVDQIGYFDAAPQNCEDYDFYIRLAAVTDFVVVPKYDVQYRQTYSSTTLTTAVEKTQRGYQILCEKVYKDAPAPMLIQKRKSMAHMNRFFAETILYRSSEKTKNFSSARFLKDAVISWPQIIFQKDTIKLLFRIIISMFTPIKPSIKLSKYL